jgi:CheY-like chemotaxis protein
MDIAMPNMDGIAATRAIRALRAPMRDVPIVAMTGNVLPQQIQSFMRAGMNDHVGKPIERNKLFRTLWRWLPQSGADEPAAAPDTSLYNAAKLSELIENIGSEKLERTLSSFERQLHDCFRADLAAARREAHDLINGAGVFGFESLLAHVRALEETRAEDDEALRLLAQCSEARDAALEVIATTIMPELESLRLRKTG